tara:strand:- start:534 stop:821 length:288 start_codon:yes stop_codon:yes gene_type:complete
MPNNSAVYIGLWWLPDSPNNKISGRGVLSKIEFFTPTILVSTDTSFNQSHFSSISCYSEEWGEWINADGHKKGNDEAIERFNYNISYEQPNPIDY